MHTYQWDILDVVCFFLFTGNKCKSRFPVYTITIFVVHARTLFAVY